MQQIVRYYMCEEALETVHRLLIHGEVARQCWDIFLNMYGGINY